MNNILKLIYSYLRKHLLKIKFLLKVYKHRGDFKRLKNISTNKNILLHFGCGPRVLSGWINIDLFFEPYEKYLKYYGDEFYGVDVRGSNSDFYGVDIIKKGLPLKDNSVDLVFHEDFIEHLSQKDQIIFLSEVFRVLKNGGVHRINTPDLSEAMKLSNFSKGREGVYTNEWNLHGHINLMTKDYLNNLSKMIGYSSILFNSRNCSISSKVPREYRPDNKDRHDSGNIFADLVK